MRCKYPGCTHEGDHRPYSREKIPSVSTIAGLLNDGKAGAFGWAAALLTASEAVHATTWRGLTGMTDRAVENGYDTCQQHKDGLCKACDHLRRHHDQVWRAKANLGTHVHHLALDWANGKQVATDSIVDPYMDALAKFYKEHAPQFVDLERTVMSGLPGLEYRGQFDAIADLKDAGRWLIDIKTGGFHPVEQTLQLAGYRYAKWFTEWEGRKESRVGPMRPVDHAGVLLLGGDGEFRLTELPANMRAYDMFMSLRGAWSFAQEVNDQFKEAV